jgi:hypothetical protein
MAIEIPQVCSMLTDFSGASTVECTKMRVALKTLQVLLPPTNPLSSSATAAAASKIVDESSIRRIQKSRHVPGRPCPSWAMSTLVYDDETREVGKPWTTRGKGCSTKE